MIKVNKYKTKYSDTNYIFLEINHPLIIIYNDALLSVY